MPSALTPTKELVFSFIEWEIYKQSIGEGSKSFELRYIDKWTQTLEPFQYAIQECIEPVLTVDNIHDLPMKITEVLPTFVLIRIQLYEAVLDLLATDPDILTFINKELRIPANQDIKLEPSSLEKLHPKVGKQARDYISLFLKSTYSISHKFAETPSENLTYFSSKAANEIFSYFSLADLLSFCYWEIRDCDIDFELYKGIVDSLRYYVGKLEASITAIFKEWDVITDVATMEAITKNIESRRETGKPVEGSKTLEEFMNELESQS